MTALGVNAWVLGFWLVGVGLCVGSFLNVLIHRLPMMLDRQWRQEAQAHLGAKDGGESEDGRRTGSEKRFNLVLPRSRCPSCGRQIRALENIPLLSWIWLRGKCAGCAALISLRYPLVEVLGVVAALASVTTYGLGWLALVVAVYLWVLIALAFIDLETGLLPDQLTLPLLWLGLLVNLAGSLTPLAAAVAGAAGGYVALWAVYWLFKLVTGKEGIGYGDFKLFAAIGAWLGWQVLPAVVLTAALGGLVFALSGIVLRRREVRQPIAFGPFLAAAGAAALIWRDEFASMLRL